MTGTPEPYLSTREAAEELNVSLRTVQLYRDIIEAARLLVDEIVAEGGLVENPGMDTLAAAFLAGGQRSIEYLDKS